MPLRFTPEDHARIREAIRAAEETTVGEIHAVFIRQSASYGAVFAALSLLLSLVTAILAAAFAAVLDVQLPAFGLLMAQALAALALFAALAGFPRASVPLLPAAIRRRAAARRAQEQFLAHNIHATAGRTGLLLFVSESEHHAEVVADSAIAARVGQEEWDAIVALLTDAARSDRLAEGYLAAVAAAGRLLAAHFPPEAGDSNELPDRLVEI